MTNSNGKQILVTQAFASGTAYADVDLEIDPVTKDIVGKSAAIVTTFANSGPGLTPDLDIAFLVQRVDLLVAPLVNQVIGFASTALTRTQSAAGESALGNLIADSQRLAIPGTDFAFMNPGGIRANIDQGTITWGEAFNVQPFGNSLVQMDLTGAQIYLLLEQQFIPTSPRFLQISGLTYTWNSLLPVGGRVVVVNKNGVPIDPAGVYRVTVNSFLAEGGDGFSVLAQGTNRVGGPIDLDAFIAFIKSLGTVTYGIEGRITRLN